MSIRSLTFLFNNPTAGELIKVRKITQRSRQLTIEIDGKIYHIIAYENSRFDERSIWIGMIPHLFEKEVPCVISIRGYGIGLIYFPEIPVISESQLHFPQYTPEITFSVCVFEKHFMNVRFARKNHKDSPNFALGCFNVRLFIQEFRLSSLHEHRIPVLWKLFVNALRTIGYFDICDYQDFQTTVLVFFQRMFIFPGHYRFSMREMFYTFVQRILANNSWFLIVGEFIQHMRRPSRDLIELFSDVRYPPISNFIDHELGFIGVSKHTGVGINFKLIFSLVSLSTNEIRVVGFDNNENYFEVRPKSREILSRLFPSNEDDDDDYDDCPLLRRRPASVDTSAISQGFTTFGNNRLIVFKLGNSMNVFIQRADGTFGPFNIYLFILSKMFAVGDELHQVSNQYSDFPYVSCQNLVEGLLECGFQPIFDGTATIEQIRAFLFEFDFGCVLQVLHQEFEGFPERLHQHCLMKYEEQRKNHIGLLSSSLFEQQEIEQREKQKYAKTHHRSHIDSIRENRFIKDFKRIFEFIFSKILERQDLSPEIGEIHDFLGQLVKFLTVPHVSE
jgi:hypothetical protein